ncbi:MAG: cytochrome-c peroxidase [Deltaproteobacteria bacterium]|nr:cytochrome-c peroxidase [Deltaproteobacteria bacterium]
MSVKKMCTWACLLVLANGTAAAAGELSPVESLGKMLFFDPNLSAPSGQSCADCHDPQTGWTGPDAAINGAGAVVEGAAPGRFGNRKPPSAAYAGFNPILHMCGELNGDGMGGGGMGGQGTCANGFGGGLFWDGRATGWTLDDPLAEQAMGPFLNPLEMNNENAMSVCLKVSESIYADLFEEVWGEESMECEREVDAVYERIARSIAAYERSAEVNPFSSKFDSFWRGLQRARMNGQQIPPVAAINMMNMAKFKKFGLDDTELMGLVVFNTKGKCSVCHLLEPRHGSQYPLFTDFMYHNLGIPANPENPFYTMAPEWNPAGPEWVDTGLGGFLATTIDARDTLGNARDYTAYAPENDGKHRTPTLRNVDKRPSPQFVKAYGHNGYFKDLMMVVHFYNCRDVPFEAQCTMQPPFPAPEVAENVNTADMGDLGLAPMEGMALVRFMATLTDVDRHTPDIDRNGCVDRADLVALMTTLRNRQLSDLDRLAYDLDDDGMLTMADARLLTAAFTNTGGKQCR